ncbi:MAG: LD-carboxypeptidase [Bacteroidetes bacterium]|nr:LD-carboxypeptidase [Bacteroidota bacterium]
MNRKKFISSVFIANASLPLIHGIRFNEEDDLTKPIIVPKYLKAGDTIGITCPAGFITDKEIQPSVQLMQNWGFNIRIGDTVNKKDFTFGGTDLERAKDFQQMLDDPNIKAIMCARGGYGSVRIIDQLDFRKFVSHPKWIIGFSDITVIHSHLNRNFNIGSIHSKMCNSFPDDMSKAEPKQIDSMISIKQALQGEKMTYTAPSNSNNKNGKALGSLVGGNLKTIESLSASKSDINTAGKILFVEDTGEYLYSIDRMFWNLKRSGKLSKIKGLIIGGFKVKPDDPGEEFGKTVYDIVLEKVKEYDYPVCFDFPVGHQKENYALKCGLAHKLEVTNSGSSLTE